MFLKHFRISVLFFFLSLFSLSQTQAQQQTYQPIPPAQVQNVKLTSPGNTIVVTWDKGTDQDGLVVAYKIYYGTTSVKDENASYQNEIKVDGGETTSFTLTNLTPGMIYYVAVTALDDEGNESDNYSVEISIVVGSGGALSILDSSITPSETSTPPQDQTSPVPPTEDLTINGNVSETQTQITTQTDSGSSATTPSDQQNPQYYGPELPADTKTTDTSASALDAPAQTQTDITAPGDVSGLKVDLKRLSKDQVVVLTWKKANDTDHDIADQIVYTKKGMESWDEGTSLGKNVEELEVETDMNQNYTVKIVTIDTSGNASQGVTAFFSTTLAKSGPADLTWLILLFGVVGFGYVFVLKRQVI